MLSPPQQKKIALRARFQKLGGEPYYQVGQNSRRGRGGAKFSEELDSQGLQRFSANIVSVAILLLIIQITIYILISLVQQNL